MKVSVLLLLTPLFLGSCNENATHKDPVQKKILLRIQPFSDLPDNYLRKVSSELKKILPDLQVEKAIPLPASALNSSKVRYRADSLIKFLAAATPMGKFTIGLTTKDISTVKGKDPDWGVMGLGFCPGRACVASTFRLNPKNKEEQLFKVVIHELGHTQGLDHCPVKTCFMRDAEGKNPCDEETAFCSNCKDKLLQRGWILN